MIYKTYKDKNMLFLNLHFCNCVTKMVYSNLASFIISLTCNVTVRWVLVSVKKIPLYFYIRIFQYNTTFSQVVGDKKYFYLIYGLFLYLSVYQLWNRAPDMLYRNIILYLLICTWQVIYLIFCFRVVPSYN